MITLGTVAAASLGQRVAVLVGIALLMTAGVYGLVAGIVKLDDLGLRLQRSTSTLLRKLGMGLLQLAPRLMKTLSVVGTAAMFMVGGGILLHGWPALGHAVEAYASTLGSLAAPLINAAAGAGVGVLAGAAIVALVGGVQRLRR